MNRKTFDQQMEHYYQLINQTDTDPATLYLQGLAPSGRRSMRSLLTTAVGILGFEDDIENIPWQILEFKHLAKIRSELIIQGKSANTTNLTLSALRGVLKACLSLGLISADKWMILMGTKPVRGKKLPSGRSLSKKEVRAIYRICKQDRSLKGKRDLAIFSMMLATGMRRSETVNLQVSDYNTRNGEVIVVAGKGSKQRKLYIGKESRQLIRPWVQARSKEKGCLFNPILNAKGIVNRPMTPQALYDVVRSRSEAAHIGFCKPHDLRRTFVTRLLEAGVDLNTVRQLAGHSSVQTTVKYDLRDEQSRRIAMRQLSLI